MHLKNKLRSGMAILGANLFNRKVPINVMWRITNKCTGRCNYCRIPLRKQKELSTQQIIRVIQQMVRAGTQRIGLVGGEPLCREDIGAIVQFLKKNNMYVTLVSNGVYVKRKLQEIIGIDYLILSLDGDRKTHEKNRPQGSYKIVINAIKAAKKRIPIMTNTVLNKDNEDAIDFILDLSKKYGFIPHFNVLQGVPSLIPKDNYHSCIQKLKLRKKQGYAIANSEALLDYYLSWGDFSHYTSSCRSSKFPVCFAGRLFCNIDTDGTLGPCDLHWNVGLNVQEVGFRKAFLALRPMDCKACTCANLVDYNYIYSINAKVIMEWLRIVNHKGLDS